MEESIRMTEDRDKWRKYVHRVVNPRIGDSQFEQNRTVHHSPSLKSTPTPRLPTYDGFAVSELRKFLTSTSDLSTVVLSHI